MNERPVSFRLGHRTHKVAEILDRWYGESSFYFKIKADDESIYLLKYDGLHDFWDFVFYKVPREINEMSSRVYTSEVLMSLCFYHKSTSRDKFLN